MSTHNHKKLQWVVMQLELKEGGFNLIPIKRAEKNVQLCNVMTVNPTQMNHHKMMSYNI
jgi:hypothetical protein